MKRWSKWKRAYSIISELPDRKINEEEYLAGKEEIRDQLRMYDGDFSELMEAVSVIEKTYSNKMNG